MKLKIKALDIEYEDGKLYVKGEEKKPDIRTLENMSELLFDVNHMHGKDPKTPTYYMYRDLAPDIVEKGYRYDITIIPAIPLGAECNKTFGHYHPKATDDLTYSELYNILSGEAYYLLQRPSEWRVEDAILVKAKEGDAVPMPPNYGHITINPEKEPLIMSNLVSPDFSSEYGDYKQKRGGAFYVLTNGKIVPNPLYSAPPEIKIKKGGCKKAFKPDILTAFYKDEKPFMFLKDPSLYRD